MGGLGKLLASETFPAEEAEAISADRNRDGRRQLLAGVRAESEERFVDAAKALLEASDWKAPELSDKVEGFELLGAADFRMNGLVEGGCDHLGWDDLRRIAQQATDPDAALAVAAFRAIELGDEAAIAAARARIDRTKHLDHSPSSDPAGMVRLGRILLDAAGSTDEERIRTASSLWGRGPLPAAIAVAIVEARGIALDETPPVLQFSASSTSRVVLKAAAKLGKEIAEEALVGVAGQKYMHDHRVGAFELPWDELHEICANQQLYLAGRLGRTVWTAYSPLEGDGRPVEYKGVRIAAKRLADETKAKKELDKKLKEQSKKLGGEPGPRKPASAVRPKHKAKALFDCVFEDHSAERVIELLAGGADPNGYAAPDDGWTALHYAGRTDSEMVRRLLAAGADPSVKTKPGLTPLDVIAGDFTGDTLRSAELLAAAGGRCGPDALLRAARWGLARKIPLLAKAGGDPKTRNDEGKTALDVAREGRYPRTLKALRAL